MFQGSSARIFSNHRQRPTKEGIGAKILCKGSMTFRATVVCIKLQIMHNYVLPSSLFYDPHRQHARAQTYSAPRRRMGAGG